MAKRATDPPTDQRRLITLQEISHVLCSGAELRHSLERVLE